MIIGFTKGVVCSISTHMKEISQETSKLTVLPGAPVVSVVVNDKLGKLAAASQNVVKFATIPDWVELTKEAIELPGECGNITRMQWTVDGQILIIATNRGHVLGYLMSFPSLFDTSGKIAILQTSLNEVTFMDFSNNKQVLGVMSLEVEPEVLKLGAYHMAVGSANTIYFYRFVDNSHQMLTDKELVNKKDYFGSIKMVEINSRWAAVLSEKRCILHTIESDSSTEERKFPANDTDKGITWIALTEEFLIMLDEAGRLRYYYIDANSIIADYKSENPLMKVFPNESGTKCIIIDNTGCGFLFNPVTGSSMILPNFAANTEKVLWDTDDANVFCTFERDKIRTYIYIEYSLEGSSVIPLPEYINFNEIETNAEGNVVPLSSEVKPVMLKNGYMFTHSKEGMKGMYLPTHSVIETWRESDTEETHLRYYMQNIALKRFKDCFRVIPLLPRYAVQLYEILGKQCLKHLELDSAERAYQLCKNPGMVLAIQSIKSEYEKFILIGHVSVLLHQHDLAEEFFLKSTRPELALEMRCDLNDWPSALKLAEKLAPRKVPFIAYKVGLQFEGEGKYAEARKYFEAAQLDDSNNVPKIKDHNKQCYAGIARTSARLGDVSRALTIAKKLEDKPLTIEVAAVCESMKQYLEAAQLFESVGMIERAAGIYIQIKYLDRAIPLIDKINSPKLLRELGKAKEAEKQYKDAEKAYERANDWENVIRLNIQHLDGIEKAKDLLRTKCPTASCALMLAEHCEKMGNRKEAVEFMLMAGKREEAFVIAQSHDVMDEYRNAIIKYDDKNMDEHSKMAQYYEGKNQWGKAAYHYDRCENPTKALKLYIQAGDSYIPEAINMVVRTRNEALINRLVDYLTGEVDGIPKDAIYTLQLYEKLNEVMKAVKIAIAISAQEQEAGNYKASHQTLFEIFKNLKNKKLAIPYELSQKLMIVHSYILAKRMMKFGDHPLAARLLCRVSTFASMFPKHAVPILTSAVLECNKVGSKAAAYQWSLVLMKPENRAQIAEKYKKRMEDIARRPVKTADPPEPTTPCPYCKSPVGELDTQCATCKNFIPFCIASGKHMMLQDWSCCPVCTLPAIKEELKRIIEADPTCPMCDKQIDVSKIVNVILIPNSRLLTQKMSLVCLICNRWRR